MFDALDFKIVGFFFQAEDGIRDRDVTGVQTCALPADLAADELIEMAPLSKFSMAQANDIIMAARAHWFADEDAAAAEAGEEATPEA